VVCQIGVYQSYDLRYFYSSKAPYTIELFKYYAQYINSFFLSINGKSKKALILDCDNTLWGGVLGEEGIENIELSPDTKNGMIYQEVQSIVYSLSKQGIIIGLCSKNNFADVEEVLNIHKDMILKDSDIVVKRINWKDKASNLIEISKELNIGLDSIVFVDDSSFEINLIRNALPQVTVLKVPEKIYNFPSLLRNNLDLFFSMSKTNEDLKKTDMYLQQIKRDDQRIEFTSLEDYLASLNICIKSFLNDSSLVPRIAQMSQKVNQFNLTTYRYTENEILKMLTNSNHLVYAFDVQDKFGSNGVTGLCIIKINGVSAEIDSFLMSCRIIGRNIEYAIMNHIVNELKRLGYKNLTSKFILTNKNKQVADFFDSCNFDVKNHNDTIKEYFLLLENYSPLDVQYIGVIKNE
jgi:FkbH-like protein